MDKIESQVAGRWIQVEIAICGINLQPLISLEVNYKICFVFAVTQSLVSVLQNSYRKFPLNDK